ncbi:MAG: hypothetical protein GYA17_08780, partial [Chloroflexi bacterium]|nr:hypothetical protein [Chloroflexota bacterium]
MWIDLLLWYLVVTLLGWLAWPVAFRLFRSLPDRGYALSRALGLLLWGFIFWSLASLGVLQNDSGGVFLALLIFAAISVIGFARPHWSELVRWAKEQARVLIACELIFLAGLVAMAVMRSADPAISGTEKPMEMAFINGILRSPQFPPGDPWLSGYAISYYYFGYVMVAMLTRLTGVQPNVAFNLAIAVWFALVALGSYGIMFNLLALWRRSRPSRAAPAMEKPSLGWPLLGPFSILILSNIEGFLEVLHSGGLFWRQAPDGSWVSSFWNWLGILELNQPPTPPFTWLPERLSGIWWWRASRVLNDLDLAHNSVEVIDEFPFFSFYLADLHPHVLVMPFALLAIGLCLQLYLYCSREPWPRPAYLGWLWNWINGAAAPLRQTGITFWLRQPFFWVSVLAFGGLGFLNIWDFPIYVGLFSAVYTFVQYRQQGWSGRRIVEFIEVALLLGVAGLGAYYPFYVGFSSQAGGILPSLSFFTRGVHFWVMFATLLLPVTVWLIYLWRQKDGHRGLLRQGFKFAAIAVGGLWLASYVLGFIGVSLPLIGNLMLNAQPGEGQGGSLALTLINLGDLLLSRHGAITGSQLLGQSLINRLASPGTWVTLLAGITLVWGLLGRFRSQDEPAPADTEGETSLGAQAPDRPISPVPFVLLLVLLGAGLTLAPEFVYLRDQFGTRMNTIFKFYFQTWILWGLAAAFASAVLLQSLRGLWGSVYRAGWSVLIIMGLVYPYFGVFYRFQHQDLNALTLDGAAYIEQFSPNEMDAIRWLRQADYGYLAEATIPGASYNPSYGRMATHSGLPNVLGWPGHESQWRGGAAEMGSRDADLRRLYETGSWDEAQVVIRQYGIRYIVVGGQERLTYR